MQKQADFFSGTIDLTNIEPTPPSDRRALGGDPDAALPA